MKKLFTLMMAALMILTLAAPVFADETPTGSITINNVGSDAKYELYKLLDLESYNVDSKAYSYKVNSAWTGFFATEDALNYVTIDDAGYVTWKNGVADTAAADFAKLALKYAQDNGIDPVQSSENAGEFVITTANNVTSGKFSNLELGYYLVDSDMGALCGLTTTNPDASINAKNGSPTLDKQVLEDSTNQWGDSNTADIGQIVYFRVTINVHAGAQNYVLHDKMTEGLTFDKVTKVEHVVPGSAGGTELATAGTDYAVKTDADLGDDCTFEVVFSEEFCNHLSTNDKIIVYYEAMLNRNAVIDGEGNSNTAWLSYGEDHETTYDSITTYTFEIDIIKTDSQNTLIDGAQFRIYDAASGGNEVAVVPLLEKDETTPVLDANGNPMYRRAREGEVGVDIVVKDGAVTVIGFDNGTYYLEETEAPDGYNKLNTRQSFTIADANLNAIFNGEIYSTGSGVHVVNKTGSMLPETGGFGTTMFIVIGSVLVLGTGVLLVTKKRMSKIVD
ncbi:MAG: SpaH/EbpB family LPXTG-anchored major pilin [Clostridia bacterium]|nr:SpaH/EbpB family LPXTG-anchored major pilin [Clostridia bacterium]